MNTDGLRLLQTAEPAGTAPLRLGEMLVASGLLRQEDIARVLQQQSAAKTRFGEAAVQLGLVSVDDVRQALVRQSVLRTLAPRSAGMSHELLCAIQPDHPLAQAIYRMRTSLFLAHKSKPGPLMLAVVGAERGEGRTFLAANLAIAFAQAGARTVLVDGDLRQGRLHTLFNVSNTFGLAHALMHERDSAEAVHVDSFDTLTVMSAGSAPNPQELLSPHRLKAVASRLALRNDVIIFDTPAWSIGSESQLVAAETGLALLVTRLHTASKDNVQALAKALARNGTSVLAVPFQ